MAAQIDPATIAGYFQPECKRINLCGHPLPIGVETMKPYLRYDGYRVKHQGEREGAILVAHGWLCSKERNNEKDRRVIIYFTPGIGYTFTYLTL